MSAVVRLPPIEVPRDGYTDLTALPTPSIGGKIWVLERKGQFLLEAGPGMLQGIACTNAGSGTIQILDGIPGDNGEFSWSEIEIPGYFGNGKQIYKANPVVMGMWQLMAGFIHGLTVRHFGGQSGTPMVASLVWMPFKKRI